MSPVLVFVFLGLLGQGLADTCKGCVQLDGLSFLKVVPKFKVTLIKFDVGYPYGDKHSEFVKFADGQSNRTDFLVAEVGIKDYGEKENQDFAASLNIDTKNLPVIALFKGTTTKVIYDKPTFTADDILTFVKANSDLHLVLSGCLEKFDKLAMKFVTTKDKQTALMKTRQIVDDVSEDEKPSAKFYVKMMEKLIENGAGFLKTEQARLEKMLKEAKVSEKKKADLSRRLNILLSFKEESSKDEL